MKYYVNGALLETDARTVSELVDQVIGTGQLAGSPVQAGVAVAVNETVVRRTAWGQTPLSDGARIEVIRAVGGG